MLPLLLALVVLAGAQASGDAREAYLVAAVLAVAGIAVVTARIVRRR
jgi:hypothetical protein